MKKIDLIIVSPNVLLSNINLKCCETYSPILKHYVSDTPEVRSCGYFYIFIPPPPPTGPLRN